MQSEILSSKDAAKFIGLAVGTLAKMRLRGDGPVFIKTGRRVFYARRDLTTWLEDRRYKSTSEY